MSPRVKLSLWLALTLVLSPGVRAQSADPEADREKWQRVPDLFAAMAVRDGSTVADVGAGYGFLTVRLAKAVGPTGKVFAIDIDPKVITALRDLLAKSSITNAIVVEGAADDPRLPAGALDAILMVNAYHEVADPATVLQRFREALKPGGRLVLCEPLPTSRSGPSRAEQVKQHELSTDFIVAEVKTAGFEIVSRDDAFAVHVSGGKPYPYSLVVASKP
jgi:ubiquinone/menaquinone biosynthesis C-methylase UbiE